MGIQKSNKTLNQNSYGYMFITFFDSQLLILPSVLRTLALLVRTTSYARSAPLQPPCSLLSPLLYMRCTICLAGGADFASRFPSGPTISVAPSNCPPPTAPPPSAPLGGGHLEGGTWRGTLGGGHLDGGHLGVTLEDFGVTWKRFGATWGSLGSILVPLGSIL